MKKLLFKKLDAFTDGPSGGNPAACIYLNSIDELTDREMLLVAQQMKGFVSEVAYIAPLGGNRFRARYFSSEQEVRFCGHASIAVCYDLLSGETKLKSGKTLVLDTNKGRLTVTNMIRDKNAVYITAPMPQHREFDVDMDEALASLGLENGQLDTGIAPGIVNAGNTTLCLCLKGLEDVIGTGPDLVKQQEFCKKYDLDVVAIYTKDVFLRSSYLRTRVFAAPFGYLEDPATGSANAALLYHLYRVGVWQGNAVTLEQGPYREFPNKIEINALQSDNAPVMFGGSAVVRIAGNYYL